MLKMLYEHISMPQSWPNQWVILFIIFIFSFVLIIILTFFVFIKQLIKIENSSYSIYQLTWEW